MTSFGRKAPGFLDLLGFSLLGALVSLPAVAALLLLAGVSYAPALWWLAYLSGAILGAVVGGNFRLAIGVVALHFLVLFGAVAAASNLVDVGWDSVQSHQAGVVGLRHGWNPFVGGDAWFHALPEGHWVRTDPPFVSGWLTYQALYAHAALFAGLPTGFEGAKGVQLLLLLTLLLNSRTLLQRSGLGSPVASAVAVVLALNPVIGYQLWTLYLDLGVAVASSLLILAIWSWSVRPSRTAIGVGLLALVLLLLAKRTGPILAAPFVVLVVAVTVTRIPRRFRPLLAVVAAGVAGILAVVPFVLGTTAVYQLNDLREMILEPARFDRAQGIKVPPHLEDLGRPELFARSLLESTDVERGAELKVPLTWRTEEWTMFRVVMYPGYTSGGFGPLFSGALVLGVIAFAGRLRLCRVPGRWIRGGLLLGILALCMVLPSSFARWVPFVWVVPLLLALEVWMVGNEKTGLMVRSLVTFRGGSLLKSGLAVAVVGISAVNGAAVLAIHLDAQREATGVVERFFDELSGGEGEAVPLAVGRSLAVKRWFLERGIAFRAEDEIAAPFREVPFTWARIPRGGGAR